jgi:diguanylate cyclase (GGDEF)-like protein
MDIEDLSAEERAIESIRIDNPNEEFRLGMFKAIANEEGLLIHINKTLIKKLQANSLKEFLYKKLFDLYYNSSDWLKHLECIRKDKECLFKNVAFKSVYGKPVYLSVYLILSSPFVYGIFRDIEVDMEETNLKRNEVKSSNDNSNDVLVINLDTSKNIFSKNINYYKENNKHIGDKSELFEETSKTLQKAIISNSSKIDYEEVEDKDIEKIIEASDTGPILTNENFYNAPFGIIIQNYESKYVVCNNKCKEIFNIKENNISFCELFLKYILPSIEKYEDYNENKDNDEFFKNFINAIVSKEDIALKVSLSNRESYQYQIYSMTFNIDGLTKIYQRVFYFFEMRKENKNIGRTESFNAPYLEDPHANIDNRTSFDSILTNSIELSKRYKKPLSLIMFGIDNFKQINDTYGQKMGDEIMQNLVLLVKSNIRKSDIFARYEGDKFMILCQETRISQAVYLAEKIRLLIQYHKFSIDQEITCGFGVAQHKEEDINSFITRVKTLLHKAKNNGGNRLEIEIIEKDGSIN